MRKIQYYITKFQKLRRDPKKGGAPHKPILLLSIIEQVEQGFITENKIFITPELIESFKNNWSDLVTTDHDLRFALPFYHLKGDGFWKLIPNKGYEEAIKLKGSMRSLRNLDLAVEYAHFVSELFTFLIQEEKREALKAILLDTYFPTTKWKYSNNRYPNSIENIEDEILEENPINYQTKYKLLQLEEDKFTRSAVFKRLVPKVYKYTCCISELQVSSISNISMIDACHIRQFSETQDDTIKNGFVLCPNLHRAFDRGLIAISDDYKVLVSNKFEENNKSIYNIKQFEGKKILLPHERKYYPAIENFRWHRKEKYLK
ncbi:MAG: HNH endonuclease [Chitinophagales bacterium]